jgi:cytochrome b561
MLPIKNIKSRYGILTMLFHWSIAFLIILNFYLIYRRDYIPESDLLHYSYMFWHKSIGVSVLFAGLIFIISRSINIKPDIAVSMTSLQQHAFFCGKTSSAMDHYIIPYKWNVNFNF